jgi:hypothetical protein
MIDRSGFPNSDDSKFPLCDNQSNFSISSILLMVSAGGVHSIDNYSAVGCISYLFSHSHLAYVYC